MIKYIYDLFLENGRIISTDSRKAAGIFFALKGDNFDANLFAEQALNSGAEYAVVDNPEIARDGRYILVDNVLETLQELANYHRKHISIPVLAITGTNGKTTTKELVRDVLKKKYNVVATQGNFNNHIGVPLTLLSIDKDADFAVVEMGANHPGEIASLCKIAEPDFGLITNIGVAHLEGFGSEDGIRKTKGELYDFLEKSGGKAFWNSKDNVLSGMILERSSLSTVPYDIDLVPIASKDGLLAFQLNGLTYQTHFVGNVNLMNISSAMSVGLYFGVDIEKALQAVTEYVPSNNRSQIIRSERNNTIILDAYNANPSSMLIALENFKNCPFAEKCMILGQMNELGEKSKELHAKILNAALKIVNSESLYLVGEKFIEIIPERSFRTSLELSEFFRNNPINGKSFLVKGSRGNNLEILKEIL